MAKTKKPKITAKQEDGDDGYCYVVRIDGVEFVNSIHWSQVPYYKEQALKFWNEKHAPKEPVVIDPEVRALVRRALLDAWNTICYGMVKLCGGHMKVQDIRECVPDYLGMLGTEQGAKAFWNLSTEQKNEILKETFTQGACL